MYELPLIRMTIVFLSVAIFAVLFSQLVIQAPRPLHRVHAGSTIPCFHPASPFCIGA